MGLIGFWNSAERGFPGPPLPVHEGRDNATGIVDEFLEIVPVISKLILDWSRDYSLVK